MKIIATREFLHGKFRFLKSACYDVPEGLGHYFLNVGWCRIPVGDESLAEFESVSAEQLDSSAPAKRGPEHASLEINKVAHGSNANVKG